MFFVEDVTEHDLPEAMLERLREEEEPLDKVVTETGWDKPWILGIEAKTLTQEPSSAPESVDHDENKDDSDTEPTLTPTLTPTPT
ncbi:MAG: hypothetical protein IKE35_06740, partial [Lachnospiraceae bacterium]|nr:hypothetical protein [Lachnospiraceae bacterium]